jgi:uncharacterized membrane protein
MAFNKINKIKKHILIVEIVNKHYIDGLTPYAAIWRKFVNPVYPMSYNTFMQIINSPGLEKQLAQAEEEQRLKKEIKEQLPGQLSLFDPNEKQ